MRLFDTVWLRVRALGASTSCPSLHHFVSHDLIVRTFEFVCSLCSCRSDTHTSRAHTSRAHHQASDEIDASYAPIAIHHTLLFFASCRQLEYPHGCLRVRVFGFVSSTRSGSHPLTLVCSTALRSHKLARPVPGLTDSRSFVRCVRVDTHTSQTRSPLTRSRCASHLLTAKLPTAPSLHTLPI